MLITVLLQQPIAFSGKEFVRKLDQEKKQNTAPSIWLDCDDDCANVLIKTIPPRASSTTYYDQECKERTCPAIPKSPSLAKLQEEISRAGQIIPRWNGSLTPDVVDNLITNDKCEADTESITRILFICPCENEFCAVNEKLKKASSLGLENATMHYSTIMNASKITRYRVFRANNVDIILFQAGKYSTTAAISTCNLLSKTKVTCALLFGLCGSISPSIRIGDICLPNEFQTHERGRQYDLGKRYRETGNHFNDFHLDKSIVYLANKEIINLIKDIYLNGLSANCFVNIENALFFESERSRIRTDIRCSTGSAFVHSKKLASFINRELGASIIDMESYGVAEACAKSDVPFSAIRVPSDKSGIDGINHINRNGSIIALYNLASAALQITKTLISKHKQPDQTNNSQPTKSCNKVTFSKKR